MCNSPQKRSTGNMPTPWLNTSAAFLLFSHETPPPSIGITVCTFGAISHHCAQRCNQKALRGDLPQLPPLFGGALPRGFPARATATRPAHSGLAGGSTLPYSAVGQNHHCPPRHLFAPHVAGPRLERTDPNPGSSPLSGGCPAPR